MQIKKIFEYIFILIGFILVIAFLYFTFDDIFGNWLVKKPWSGTYYNSINSNLAKDEKFKNREECTQWAVDQAKSNNKGDGEWSFTCGKDCKYVGRKPGDITDRYECAQIYSE